MTQGDANRQHICINILDDDSLLNIFYHSRPPVLFVEGDDDGINLCGGTWECEYWWYKISWVCRRWRRLIHASPSYLGISLVCRSGISLSDMLAHSPPFPLCKGSPSVELGIRLCDPQREPSSADCPRVEHDCHT